MGLESNVDQIQELNPSWPTGGDPKSQGDDHLRNIKAAIQGSFPGMSAPWFTTSQIRGGGFDAGNARIQNVGIATANTDATTKAVADAISARVTTIETNVPDTFTMATINSNGAIAGQTGGAVSVTRTAVGKYTLTFTKVALGTYQQGLSATAVGAAPLAGGNSIMVNPVSATQWTVETFGATDAAQDLGFTITRHAFQ